MAESVALKESIEVATSAVHNGTIAGSSESPARGISGANPKRLVNGEAVSALVVSEADMQRLSNQTVLKKALSVSEAELLQSAIAEEEKLAVDGTSVAVNDLDAQLEKSKSQATDNQVQVSIPSLSQSVATASNSGTLSVALPSSESSTGLSSVPPSAAHLHGGVSSVAIGGGANSATSQLGGKSLGNTSKHLSSSPGAKVGGARNGSHGNRQHRSGGSGGVVMTTPPSAANNVYYHYVPVPNAPLYYTQPQQYPSTPAVHPSLTQPPTVPQEKLSSTNLYIRGLSRVCSDEDLVSLCKQYGKIVSTKAILDKHTNLCKGYGFVDFENPNDALKAVQYLQGMGIIVQFAKLPVMEQDPTNLYFSNLPKEFDERELESLISPYGVVVSTRILRDHSGVSRGVGFARMETQEACDRIIDVLKGSRLPGHNEPLQIKFADSGSKKKHSQNRWRDMQEQQYIYDSTVLPQNGIVNSHGIVRQGVLAQQYVPTPAAAIPGAYQVPVSGVSSHNWAPTFYMQPTNPIVSSSTVDSVHGLGAQMSGLQISTAGGGAYPALPPGAGQPQHNAAPQYHITAHAPQYTHQTTSGWNVQHLSTPASVIHQDPSSDHIGSTSSALTEPPSAMPATHPPHPIQVINPPDHTYRHHINAPQQSIEGTSHSVHVYHPSSVTTTWSGK